MASTKTITINKEKEYNLLHTPLSNDYIKEEPFMFEQISLLSDDNKRAQFETFTQTRYIPFMKRIDDIICRLKYMYDEIAKNLAWDATERDDKKLKRHQKYMSELFEYSKFFDKQKNEIEQNYQWKNNNIIQHFKKISENLYSEHLKNVYEFNPKKIKAVNLMTEIENECWKNNDIIF